MTGRKWNPIRAATPKSTTPSPETITSRKGYTFRIDTRRRISATRKRYTTGRENADRESGSRQPSPGPEVDICQDDTRTPDTHGRTRSPDPLQIVREAIQTTGTHAPNDLQVGYSEALRKPGNAPKRPRPKEYPPAPAEAVRRAAEALDNIRVYMILYFVSQELRNAPQRLYNRIHGEQTSTLYSPLHRPITGPCSGIFYLVDYGKRRKP